jgi:predicted Zn-dependent protease
MKHPMLVVVALLAFASPSFAQLGGLGSAIRRAQEARQRFDDLTITDAEERQIGEMVSIRIRARFGVVQDPAVHKYVALVGTTVASASSRANLPWTFIVLDTDGVNAFASPGGFVHITRGALGLIQNEAELAGVLGHEIAHVTQKHTVNAIQKNKSVQIGTEQALSSRGPFLDAFANRAYEMVLENNFDRADELDADKVALELAAKSGYLAASLASFLTRLDERNKDSVDRNGLFASHPETNERIERIRRTAAQKPVALVAARYTSTITYKATPITAIAVLAEEPGASALTGNTKPAQSGSTQSGGTQATPAGSTQAAQEEEKKRGFGLGALRRAVAPEQQSQQVAASGGARGVGRDRAARGGSNPAMVQVTISPAELAAFKKGIA